jgi:hypothetical protein
MPSARDQDAKHAGAETIVKIEPMDVLAGSKLGGHAGEGATGLYPDDAVDVGIVTEQWGVCLLGEHGDAGRWMPVAYGAEERSGQEDVADRAEAHGQDGRGRGGVVHGEKVPLWLFTGYAFTL